jgi:hypothetical protein
MSSNRKPTAHQRQMRFLLYFFGTLMILAVVGVIILLNRPVGGFHYHH